MKRLKKPIFSDWERKRTSKTIYGLTPYGTFGAVGRKHYTFVKEPVSGLYARLDLLKGVHKATRENVCRWAIQPSKGRILITGISPFKYRGSVPLVEL